MKNTMLYVGAAAVIAFLLYKKNTAQNKPIPTPKEPKKPQQPADALLNFSTNRDYSSAAPITPTTTTTTPTTTTTTTPTTTTTTTTPKKAVVFNAKAYLAVPKFSPSTNIAGLFKQTINGHKPICNY